MSRPVNEPAAVRARSDISLFPANERCANHFAKWIVTVAGSSAARCGQTAHKRSAPDFGGLSLLNLFEEESARMCGIC
jgi:hypothetical protein